ncbi:pyridoxamine 5'-phosphate oxidase [Mesobaculum littorinae]|uniref:Pyridoxamine 5'-phosphate oxidase n=1 Tax=Mesobaculum littorinae TaxID=2486419 RepID=A0A438ALL9_9RHOB|nr:pyridoxamine 5'-phosphate oxidase family protein [Mesobaculum littorinae]RVV99569.1 pyridoxamine 5'-phosphate oxidase [Mesobaculum littorinae]
MTDLAGHFATAWRMLDEGAADPHAPAHLLTLATNGAGFPEARMVALRGADRAAGVIEIETDAATAKVAQLLADPRATALAWDPARSVQLRLRLRVTVVTGPDLHARWEAMPAHRRLNYGGAPPPGTPLPEPEAYAKHPERARLALLRGQVEELELLDLSGEMHLRALWRAEDGFAGGWIAP